MEVVLIKKNIPQPDFCGLCLTESHIAIFPLLGDTWKSNLLFAKPLICRNSTLRVSANKSVKKIPNFHMQNLSIGSLRLSCLHHRNKTGYWCFQSRATSLLMNVEKRRACPGFEPGTSRTQSENHTPRPTGHCMKWKEVKRAKERHTHQRIDTESTENKHKVICTLSSYRVSSNEWSMVSNSGCLNLASCWGPRRMASNNFSRERLSIFSICGVFLLKIKMLTACQKISTQWNVQRDG